MIRILHLFDASAGWEQRVAVSQLIDRLPETDYTHHLAAIDAAAINAISIDTGIPKRLFEKRSQKPSRDRGQVPLVGGAFLDPETRALPYGRGSDKAAHTPSKTSQTTESDIVLVRRRFGWPAWSAPGVRSLCRRESVNLIHAWGADAAAAARAALPDGVGLVVTIFDPGLCSRDVRVLRTVTDASPAAVVCTSQRVERRLIEQGVRPDTCVVLRPGVRFSTTPAADRKRIRAELDLPPDAMVVVTPEARTDTLGRGRFAVLWSGLMRWHVDNNVRIVLPGSWAGDQRLRRLVRESQSPEIAVFTEGRYRFEELLAAADWLVLGAEAGAEGDVPTTAIAWAMAASVPVIAPATHATAELLSAGETGIVYKPSESGPRVGATICALYDRTEHLATIKEAARGEAYRFFRVSRAIEQHRQLYTSLLAGRLAGPGIEDPASIGVAAP